MPEANSPITEDQTQTVIEEVTGRQPTAAELVSSRVGTVRYASAEDLLANAPKDIKEKDVEDVFGGLTVRIRGLTAAQSAHVKQLSFTMKGGRTPELAWSQMECAQFSEGVIQPKMSPDQVLMLHRTAGPSFTKVIEEIDALTGTNKEQLRKAQKEFQESG